VHAGFWWGNLRKDLCIDGRIILKWIFKKYEWQVDWFDLPQGRDTWRAFMYRVMNLWAQ
jgi:hypothetical protein